MNQASQPRKQAGVYLSLILYSALIATSFPVGEAIANAISPTELTFLRFVAAALVFLVIILIRQDSWRPSTELLWKTAVLALVMAIFFSLMFKALQTASALNTGAIFTLSPLFSLFFGVFINQVRASALQVFSLLVGAAGATWIVFDGSIDALIAFRVTYAEVLFLIGTICFSLYSPIAKRFFTARNPVVVTFWVLVFSAVFTGGFSLYQTGPVDVSRIPLGIWSAIIFLAVFPTAVTFFISIRASALISPFKVTSFVYLTPAFIALIELMTMGRGVSLSVAIGILITAVATLLIQINGRKPR